MKIYAKIEVYAYDKIIQAIPDTRYQIPDTRYQIPDTRYQIPDTRYQIPVASCSKVIFKVTFPDCISLKFNEGKVI
uniref:hypothetical protein n=1 Tax=Klebsiella pneumoniae TaxID=573 RepID=UPI00350E4943